MGILLVPVCDTNRDQCLATNWSRFVVPTGTNGRTFSPGWLLQPGQICDEHIVTFFLPCPSHPQRGALFTVEVDSRGGAAKIFSKFGDLKISLIPLV
jgi:hypothetical protein